MQRRMSMIDYSEKHVTFKSQKLVFLLIQNNKKMFLKK